jgi:hypothetical protein
MGEIVISFANNFKPEKKFLLLNMLKNRDKFWQHLYNKNEKYCAF